MFVSSLDEKELEEINKLLEGKIMGKQKEDWREDSRKRVNDAVQFGNYRHPRYRGGLSEEAIRTLEQAKRIFGLETPIRELVESTKKDLNGNGK